MYVKVTNGTPTEYTIGQLRRDNPNVSFPKQIPVDTLAEFDVYQATIADVPSYDDRTQKVTQDTEATEIDGVWTYGWSVESKTSDEVQAYDDLKESNVRSKRDELLAETDWWASSDLTMTAEQTAYRQALRDITTHANFPNLEDADWPTKP